jgi:secondary thiamine-phosphate synthase enzyme
LESFNVRTTKREELIDITSNVQRALEKSKTSEGFCVVFVPHTTAGVTINENADPTVRRDIIKGLTLIPESGYAHSEGNSPAHIKSSLIGQSLTILVENGRLVLGTWQGIYFAEFDGPRHRSVWVKVVEG